MKEKKLHVLVIPSWYPTGEDKLMGQYHKDFTEALNKRNDVYANMIFIYRERLKEPVKYLKEKKWETVVENNYVTLIHKMLNVRPISKKLQVILYNHKVFEAYRKYVKLYGKPDVIHAHVTLPAGYAACKLGNKYNLPVVVTEHGTFEARFFKKPYAKYGEYVLNHSVFSVVSRYLEKKLYPFVLDAELLPNQVDTKEFDIDKNKKPNDTIDLIQVCALRKAKRTDLIMDAMKVLMEKYKYKNIHLTVVGDGFEADYFKNICKDKKMTKYVTFVGQKNKSQIVEYLKKTDISVIASDFETFAIPAIESLSAGIPVVSTKCGGPEEYMDDKCGALCNVDDAEDMAKSIDKVYKNIKNYDKKYLKSVADKYSEENITEQALKLYQKAMDQLK